MARFTRLLADVSPLRDSPPFRRLWAGTTLSAVGSALTRFAVMLQVYDLTRSSFAVGAIGLAQLVPLLLIGLPGGSLADGLDRRKLVLVCYCGLTLTTAGLAAAAFAGSRDLWLLYVLVTVQACISSVSVPARQTFVPRLLPPDKLQAGLALNRFSFQIMLIV